MDDINKPQQQNNLSPEQITKLGDEYYFGELKDSLEKDHFGAYVVIEVASKKYYVDSDLKTALEKAQTDFPDKLFHIIKIGNLQKLSKETHYEWLL